RSALGAFERNALERVTAGIEAVQARQLAVDERVLRPEEIPDRSAIVNGIDEELVRFAQHRLPQRLAQVEGVHVFGLRQEAVNLQPPLDEALQHAARALGLEQPIRLAINVRRRLQAPLSGRAQ